MIGNAKERGFRYEKQGKWKERNRGTSAMPEERDRPLIFSNNDKGGG